LFFYGGWKKAPKFGVGQAKTVFLLDITGWNMALAAETRLKPEDNGTNPKVR
jgi:hypothetical protein